MHQKAQTVIVDIISFMLESSEVANHQNILNHGLCASQGAMQL